MREFEPRVKEALDGLVEDFRQALLNETDSIAEHAKKDKIDFMCLSAATKIVPNILRMTVESINIGVFGDQMGGYLVEASNRASDRRVTIALAEDIRENMGEEVPQNVRDSIDEILKKLKGGNPDETD